MNFLFASPVSKVIKILFKKKILTFKFFSSCCKKTFMKVCFFFPCSECLMNMHLFIINSYDIKNKSNYGILSDCALRIFQLE